ncbi:helix-turn-helix transcriptional regulator [Caulobacter sp. BE254]|uniref:helix-turn-helix domain-containing protein n=1 Tax=Caulobacter sp. BE254 TaxID=2817720 RepID=UPI0028649C42|nr:helix-turn-helix transcriptional regulator [Caulobacter sp. BE254]MDR7115818.1 transcriptional regulator with XRE-family HTH domain [Caulobacter sp. BE254]
MTLLAPPQVRMARAALGISVRELAERSGVAESTILRFETGRGGILAANLDKVQTTLEEGGVVFISADASGGPGVRLAK